MKLGKRKFGFTIIALLLTFSLNGLLADEQDNLFTVERMLTASGIEAREPVNVSDTFPLGTERVYCFLEARDIKQDTKVTFVWYHGEKKTEAIELELKSGPRWRTWSYKTLFNGAGEWMVELQDENGQVIQTVRFLVE